MAKERIIGYDIIRIIAAAMVVAIHSNVFYLLPKDGSLDWFVVMELTALCVVAVPLFFMVSGAVNIGDDRPCSIRDLYRRRLPRLFIPFLCWSLIYVVARIASGKLPLSADAFLSLIWEPAYYQFWFIYTLLGLYICIPIFHALLHKTSKTTAQYILLLWFITSIVLPTLIRYIPGFKWSEHLNMVFLEGYWGYFFLGGYLHKYPVKSHTTLSTGLIIGGYFLTLIFSALEYFFSAKYQGQVYCDYLLPGAVLASVGMFILLGNVRQICRLKSSIVVLSALSMGVYYVHYLIILIVESVMVKLPYFSSAFLVKWGLVLIVTYILCWLGSKLPILKKII